MTSEHRVLFCENLFDEIMHYIPLQQLFVLQRVCPKWKGYLGKDKVIWKNHTLEYIPKECWPLETFNSFEQWKHYCRLSCKRPMHTFKNAATLLLKFGGDREFRDSVYKGRIERVDLEKWEDMLSLANQTAISIMDKGRVPSMSEGNKIKGFDFLMKTKILSRKSSLSSIWIVILRDGSLAKMKIDEYIHSDIFSPYIVKIQPYSDNSEKQKKFTFSYTLPDESAIFLDTIGIQYTNTMTIETMMKIIFDLYLFDESIFKSINWSEFISFGS